MQMREFILPTGFEHLHGLRRLLSGEISVGTGHLLIPEKIDGDAEVIMHSRALEGESLAIKLKTEAPFFASAALQILKIGHRVHCDLRVNGLLGDLEVIPLQHWYILNSNPESTVIDLASYYGTSCKTDVPPVWSFAKIYSELCGNVPALRHGAFDYKPIPKLGAGLNQALIGAFSNPPVPFIVEDFLDQIEKNLPSERNQSDGASNTHKGLLPRGVNIESPSALPSSRRKRLGWLWGLAGIVTAGIAIFASLNYPSVLKVGSGQSTDEVIEIRYGDELPSAVRKLELSKSPEQRAKVFAQAVELFGYHPELWRFNPGVPEKYPTISEAIKAIGGKETIYIAPGTYTETIQLLPNVTLVGLSDDASKRPVIQPTEDTLIPLVQGEGCKTVTIENIEFRRDEEEGLEVPHIDLRHTTLILRKCRVLNSTGTGIILSGRPERPSEITDCIISGSRKHGIHLSVGATASINASEMTRCSEDGLRVEDIGSYADINGSKFFENKRGLQFQNQAFGKINGAICSKNKQQGVAVFKARVSQMKDLVSVDNGDSGLYISFGIVQRIIDSKFSENKQHGIFIEDPTDIRDENEERVVRIELSGIEAELNEFSGLFLQIIEPTFESTNKLSVIPELFIDGEKSSMSRNLMHGISVTGPASLEIDGAGIQENKGHGIKLKNKVELVHAGLEIDKNAKGTIDSDWPEGVTKL